MADFTQQIEKLEKEIIKLNARNKRVEEDKAWETSTVRKLLITLLTYVTVVVFMYVAEIQDYFVNAAIPAGGYFLSTLTIPFAKRIWTTRIYRR